MRLWLSNQIALGVEAWDPAIVPLTNCPVGIGLEYPAGSCFEHLFGAGPALGAIVDGVRRVDQAYDPLDGFMEFLPERGDTARDRIWQTSINNAREPNHAGVDDDGDGRTDEDELDGMDNDGDWNILTDDLGSDGLPDSLEVSCNGKVYDPVSNPDPAYDNYDPTAFDSCHTDLNGNPLRKNDKNKYTQNNGIPDHGEPHVDEDYAAFSDNDFGVAATDTFKSFITAGHVPIGAKVWQKSYAWHSGTSADAIIFQDYSLVDIGSKTWRDAYVGMFADMDVGPVNISQFYTHNYAAFDSGTRTAYVQNPLDAGSTPLGLTFLGSSKPPDTGKFIFQYFVNYAGQSNLDTIVYGQMSGLDLPAGQLIKPDQNPNSLGDVSLFLSTGPFQAAPGDTIRETYAFVSGSSVTDMLNNARRAHRIYSSKYFIMPVIRITDPGGGQPVTLSWDPIVRSPYGPVLSYTIFYGLQPDTPTDSITTTGDSSLISSLLPGKKYYFSVLATDDMGHRSALSDVVSNVPNPPQALKVIDEQRSILVEWQPNAELDLAGYNIYRQTSTDTTEARLNPNLLHEPAYLDTAVWGDKDYFYKVSAVDMDGHEGDFSEQVRGHLIPPATPANFTVGPGKTFLHPGWSPSTESDLAGYNIYRRSSTDTAYRKLNAVLWKKNDYPDSAIARDSDYTYYAEAVDSTGAVSAPTAQIVSHTVAMDQGVLVIYQAADPSIPSISFADTVAAFYESLLTRSRHHLMFEVGVSVSPFLLGQYSTVFWLREDPAGLGIFPATSYPTSLRGFLLGGGKFMVAGRGFTSLGFPYWYQFLSEVFGIDLLTQTSPVADLDMATGYQGFPPVSVDPIKLSRSGGRAGSVERFPSARTGQVVYRFRSDPFDSTAEGQPIGLRAVDTSLRAYYFSFPLYDLDFSSASSMVTKVLTDFDELTVVSNTTNHVPHEFRLYDAYPNPFNPSTHIEFDLAVTSDVNLTACDLLGREVAHLAGGRMQAGHYSIVWDASRYASGVYFYRMDARESRPSGARFLLETKKILLLK